MGYLPYDLTVKAISWIIVMIYCGIFGTIFLVKAIKATKEVKFQRNMYRTISIILFLYVVIRVFFLLSDFERDANSDTLLYYQFVVISYITTAIAFLNIIYFLESTVLRKTKHAISYIIIIMIIIDVSILILFNEYIQMVRYFNYALSYTEVGLILLVYLYLTVKSTGKLRQNSFLSLLGLALAGVASFLEMDALLMTGAIPAWLSPTIFAIGITIFAYSYIRSV